jgi:hypothetical protein
MILVALAFFITARTEPVDPGPDKFGWGTSIVLYDAPSQESAHQWAKAFVHGLLLKGHRELKLTELKVLPVNDRLFTSTGTENIDWPSSVEHASASNDYNDPSLESHDSMMVTAPNAHEPDASAEANDIEAFKKRVPHPDG